MDTRNSSGEEEDSIEHPDDSRGGEQPPPVGLDRELLQKQRELISSMTQPSTSSGEVVKNSVSEMGQKIINMFTNPDNPHPHSIDYREKLFDLMERINKGLADPTCTPPRFPGTKVFAGNRAQYVYSMNDPPGTAPVIEIKSQGEGQAKGRERRRMVVHAPSRELIELVREASKRSKKKNKEKKSGKAERSKEEVYSGPVIAAVDDDLDIFAGLDMSSDVGTKVDTDSGPLFTDSTIANSAVQEDLEAVRSRLVGASQIRQEARGGGGIAIQKRGLEIGEENFMDDAGEFGHKLDKGSFGQYEEGRGTRREGKSRKKEENKRTPH
jgi:hypothetical protein